MDFNEIPLSQIISILSIFATIIVAWVSLKKDVKLGQANITEHLKAIDDRLKTLEERQFELATKK